MQLNKAELAAMLAQAINLAAMERIEELVRQGAELDRRDSDDYLLPLERAIGRAHVDVVRLLLRLGADVHGDPKRGDSPLMRAIPCGNADLVGALIDAGAKVDLPSSHGSTPLGVAEAWGHQAVIERLRAAGARRAVRVVPPVLAEYRARHGYPPIPAPAAAPPADACARAEAELQAAFLAAIDSQEIPRIRELLGKEVALNKPDDQERTPLEHAIETGNPDLVRLLLEAGAKPDQGGFYFPSTLCYAAECGNLEVVQALAEAGADLDKPMRFLGSPLKIAVKNGHLAIVQWLLAQGAKPEVGPDCHVIQWAAELGQEAILQALLPLVSDDLRAAAERAYARFLELERREAHVPSNCLCAAAKGDHPDAARQALADGADINARDRLGRGPLHLAVREGEVEMVAFLLEQGADPNLLSEGRSRAPHFEAEKDKQADVIGLLAKGGANLNAVDCWGWTALEHAASAGEVRLTEALLEAGADPLDRTPQEWVREARRVRATLPRGTAIYRPLEFRQKGS
jgi:ankyrin repeat protein